MKSIKHKAEEEIIRVLADDIKATEVLIEKHVVTKDSTIALEDLALSVKEMRVREAMAELELLAEGAKEENRELQEELEKTYKPKFFNLSIPELETLSERIRDHGCIGCDYNCPASCIYDPDAPNGFGEGGKEPWYPAVCPLYPDMATCQTHSHRRTALEKKQVAHQWNSLSKQTLMPRSLQRVRLFRRPRSSPKTNTRLKVGVA